MADFKKIFNEKVDDKTTEMTSEFKDIATSSGWGPELISSVTVGPTSFNISGPSKSLVEDAEYGFKNSPPRAAMRKYTPTFQKHMVSAAGAAALDFLSSEGKELFSS